MKILFVNQSYCQNVIKSFLVLFVASAVFITLAADTSPNVVLLISDDHGWGDVGYHGSEIATPNIDRLVHDGMELNRFYTASGMLMLSG